MENSKIEQKLDRLIELQLRALVLSMYESGHNMNEISKNLHISKSDTVKHLAGLVKKGKKAD